MTKIIQVVFVLSFVYYTNHTCIRILALAVIIVTKTIEVAIKSSQIKVSTRPIEL